MKKNKYQLKKGSKFINSQSVTYYNSKKEVENYIKWCKKTFPNEFWYEITKVPSDYPYYK
jgi:hypothetical protein